MQLLPGSQIHLAGVFPHYLDFWGRRLHPHVFFEILAYLVGIVSYLSLRKRFGDPLFTPIRWATFAVAVAGATLGSRLLFLLEDPQLTWQRLDNVSYLMSGKTIVGALFLGLLAVEGMKRFIGLNQSTGDLYAIPLALGIAIGRIGCFLTGLSDNTFGIASTLPWAVDFGDGVRRHPTQLYEAAFLVALLPVLHRVMVLIRQADPHQRLQPGDAFKFFMVAYMLFRLLCDFIKPYPRILLGLGGIQWVCLLALLYYSRDIIRWLSLKRKVVTDTGAPVSI